MFPKQNKKKHDDMLYIFISFLSNVLSAL
jgi:hypothetical protein